MADIATLDPRTWTARYARTGEPQVAPLPAVEPVAVGLDLLDEEHSLMLAMCRLAADVKLRQGLGRRGQVLWQARFTLDRMVAGYLTALADALATKPDAVGTAALPPHVRADGTEFTTGLLRDMGLPESQIARVWTKDAR
jgi:hypothetical protein